LFGLGVNHYVGRVTKRCHEYPSGIFDFMGETRNGDGYCPMLERAKIAWMSFGPRQTMHGGQQMLDQGVKTSRDHHWD
jgi:hypothetical protein